MRGSGDLTEEFFKKIPASPLPSYMGSWETVAYESGDRIRFASGACSAVMSCDNQEEPAPGLGVSFK